MFGKRAILLGRALFLLCGFAILLSACGGGSGGSDSSDGGTKVAFVARANAICETTDEVQAAGYKAFSKKHDAKERESKSGQEQTVLQVGLPAIATELEELRELEVPAGDEKKVEAILTSAEAALKKAEADPSLIFKTKTDPFNAAEKLSKAYGLRECGLT